MLGAGYLSKLTAGLFWDVSRPDIIGLLPPFLASGVLYVIVVSVSIAAMPWLIGMGKDDVKDVLKKFGAIIHVG